MRNSIQTKSNNSTTTTTNVNQLDLDTFFLTSFLLNYDIGDKIVNSSITDELEKNLFIITRLLEIIIINIKYPLELLLSKFFEYVIWKNISLDKINHLLCKKLNLTNESDDIDEFKIQFKEYFDLITSRPINFKPFVHSEAYKKVNQIIGMKLIKLNAQEQTKHKGQPLPDPDLGRPKLNWKYCQYTGCKQCFSSTSALVNHLIQSNVYTRGFHSSHEDAIKLNNLTPEKILTNNITKCPSYICENKTFKTPQDLIEHIKLLGIEPFWEKGMELTCSESRKKLPDFKSNRIYMLESCVICLENPVEIFINKCGHHVYCIDCLDKSSKIICPMCRGKVDMFLPYA